MKRFAIGITTLLGSAFVAEALLFQPAGDYPNNFPGSPLIGIVGLVVIGLLAGLLARIGGLALGRGWTAMMIGAVMGLGLGLVFTFIEPHVFHLTALEVIGGLGWRMAAAFAALTAGYALVHRSPVQASPGVRSVGRPSRTMLLTGAAALVTAVGLPTLVAAEAYSLYDPGFATVRVTISAAGITLEPSSIPAGGVNLLLTYERTPTCRVGDPFVAVPGGAPSAAGTDPLHPPAPPEGVLDTHNIDYLLVRQGATVIPIGLPSPVSDYPLDGVATLAPGTAIWSCGDGEVHAEMAVR